MKDGKWLRPQFNGAKWCEWYGMVPFTLVIRSKLQLFEPELNSGRSFRPSQKKKVPGSPELGFPKCQIEDSITVLNFSGEAGGGISWIIF